MKFEKDIKIDFDNIKIWSNEDLGKTIPKEIMEKIKSDLERGYSMNNFNIIINFKKIHVSWTVF